MGGHVRNDLIPTGLGYTLTSGTGVLRNDGAYIPDDPASADWQTYQMWLISNTPLPATGANLQDAMTAQIAVVSAACGLAITAGFTSSATGTQYLYPSTPQDQANMSVSVLASTMPGLPAGWTTPFMCQAADGTWSFVTHTAAQIQKAGQDGFAAILALRERNQTLATQILACTSLSAVQAINW